MLVLSFVCDVAACVCSLTGAPSFVPLVVQSVQLCSSYRRPSSVHVCKEIVTSVSFSSSLFIGA